MVRRVIISITAAFLVVLLAVAPAAAELGRSIPVTFQRYQEVWVNEWQTLYVPHQETRHVPFFRIAEKMNEVRTESFTVTGVLENGRIMVGGIWVRELYPSPPYTISFLGSYQQDGVTYGRASIARAYHTTRYTGREEGSYTTYSAAQAAAQARGVTNAPSTTVTGTRWWIVEDQISGGKTTTNPYYAGPFASQPALPASRTVPGQVKVIYDLRNANNPSISYGRFETRAQAEQAQQALKNPVWRLVEERWEGNRWVTTGKVDSRTFATLQQAQAAIPQPNPRAVAGPAAWYIKEMYRDHSVTPGFLAVGFTVTGHGPFEMNVSQGSFAFFRQQADAVGHARSALGSSRSEPALAARLEAIGMPPVLGPGGVVYSNTGGRVYSGERRTSGGFEVWVVWPVFASGAGSTGMDATGKTAGPFASEAEARQAAAARGEITGRRLVGEASGFVAAGFNVTGHGPADYHAVPIGHTFGTTQAGLIDYARSALGHSLLQPRREPANPERLAAAVGGSGVVFGVISGSRSYQSVGAPLYTGERRAASGYNVWGVWPVRIQNLATVVYYWEAYSVPRQVLYRWQAKAEPGEVPPTIIIEERESVDPTTYNYRLRSEAYSTGGIQATITWDPVDRSYATLVNTTRADTRLVQVLRPEVITVTETARVRTRLIK